MLIMQNVIKDEYVDNLKKALSEDNKTFKFLLDDEALVVVSNVEYVKLKDTYDLLKFIIQSLR